MGTEKNLKFPPITHIGYIVDCLEANTAAFAELYGVYNFDVYEFKPLRAWAYGKELFDCCFRIAMGKVEQGINIELIQPISGFTPHSEFLKRGGGMHHFCISVKNFDTWRSHFNDSPNADIIFEANVCDEKRGFRRCIYVQTNKRGSVVEFSEIPEKSKSQ